MDNVGSMLISQSAESVITAENADRYTHRVLAVASDRKLKL